MNSYEWATCLDPMLLVHYLSRVSLDGVERSRRLRLAGLSVWRASKTSSVSCLVAVAAAGVADGIIDGSRADDIANAVRDLFQLLWHSFAPDSGGAALLLCGKSFTIDDLRYVVGCLSITQPAEVKALYAWLIRDVFGDPFRLWPETFTLHHPGPLASTRYATVPRAWQSLLPLAARAYVADAAKQILADALEDAGVPTGYQSVVDHLRVPGLHPRGCWAVDLVMGKYEVSPYV
jgi:hypothetical protein